MLIERDAFLVKGGSTVRKVNNGRKLGRYAVEQAAATGGVKGG
jgi:hypothetical protein